MSHKDGLTMTIGHVNTYGPAKKPQACYDRLALLALHRTESSRHPARLAVHYPDKKILWIDLDPNAIRALCVHLETSFIEG